MKTVTLSMESSEYRNRDSTEFSKSLQNIQRTLDEQWEKIELDDSIDPARKQELREIHEKTAEQQLDAFRNNLVGELRNTYEREISVDSELGAVRIKQLRPPRESEGAPPGFVERQEILKIDNKWLTFMPDAGQAYVRELETDIWDELPGRIGLLPDSIFNRIDSSSVSVETQMLGENEVLMYEGLFSEVENASIRLYLDQQLNFRYRRIEWLSNGALIKVEIAEDYEKIGNDYVPMFLELSRFEINDPSKLRDQTTTKVVHAELNPPFSTDLFSIPFPQSTTVIDLDRGLVVRTPSIGDILGAIELQDGVATIPEEPMVPVTRGADSTDEGPNRLEQDRQEPVTEVDSSTPYITAAIIAVCLAMVAAALAWMRRGRPSTTSR